MNITDVNIIFRKSIIKGFFEDKLVNLDFKKSAIKHPTINGDGLMQSRLLHIFFDIETGADYPDGDEWFIADFLFPYDMKISDEIIGPDYFTTIPTTDNKKKAEDIIKKGKLHPIKIHDRENVLNKIKTMRVGTIGKGGQGERIYSVNGHSATLTASTGGVASKTQAYLVNGKVRKLTPLECKRLMGFPDDFKMDVIDGTAYTLLGNSVVVPVLKLIYGEIKQTICKNGKN